MIANASGWLVSGPIYIVPRRSSLTLSAVRPSRRCFIGFLSRAVSAPAGGRGEIRRFVTVVGRVQRPAGRDDLVDAVERLGVERHVGTRDQVVELLHRLRPDDGRRDGRVRDAPREREVGERYTGVGRDLLELFDRVELALVVRG